MSREEMIRLARHCNLGLLVGPLYALLDDEWERLHRFAALAAEWGAKQEREACAKVCEGISKDQWTKIGREHAPFMEATAKDCAEAIRKRGEVKP